MRPSASTRRRFLTLCAAASCVAALPGAGLASTAPRGLSPEDRAEIAKVEAYLNEIRTLRARFLQIADNGATAEGTLYLWRPGRLRLEYDPPVPILMVANGSFLIHYDKELKAVTHLPIDSTPAGLLVRERIQLSGDVTVTKVERGPGSLRVTLVQSKDPQAGRITLVFSERPFALSNWQVVDAQGSTTRVALMEPHAGMPLDPALFRFTDPGMLAPRPAQ
jgi:outer membrane lipoprotein-sorting protein